MRSGGSTGVFQGLCRCLSLGHARGTTVVLIWQIERCSWGGVCVRERGLGSHPWNSKNKLNFCSLKIVPPPFHFTLGFLIEFVPGA